MITLEKEIKKIITNSGINFLFRIAGLLFSFLTLFLISRLFGISDYGKYSLVFTLAQAFTIIFALGIPNALILLRGDQKLQSEESKGLLFKGIKLTSVFSILPCCLLFFGAELFAGHVFKNPELLIYFKIVAFALPFAIIHELFLNHFIVEKKFLLYNLFMFLLPNVLLGLFLAIFHYTDKAGYFTLVAYSISTVLIVLAEFILVYGLKRPIESQKISFKKLLTVARPMMFSGLLLYLLNWTDVIMLGMMVPDKDVGLYNIAYKVGSAGFLVIVSVSTIITPRLAELFGEGKLEELKRTIQKSTQLIAFLSIFVSAFLILFGPFILSFFGKEATAGVTAFNIIVVGVFFSAISGNVDQILNMTKHQNILQNITLFSFVFKVVLNFILIPNYGLNGAAIASLISNVAINLLCLYYIKKKLGFYTLF